MKKRSVAIIMAILAVVLCFALAACGGDKNTDGNATDGNATNGNATAGDVVSEMATIKEKGKIVVGITDYEPMNYQENGEWVGFDTELTYAFAEKLGVEVEFYVIADWGKKFIELKAGAIDCVWNGMTITPEALSNSSVSDPYLTNSQVVVLAADKAAEVASVEDLKGLSLAVEEGSAGQTAGNDEGLTTVAVKDMATALMEVKSGACDGCIIDKTMADATVGAGNSYANLAVAMTLSTEKFGISFREGSDLTAELNAFIEDYKASGEFKALADKYGVTVED